MQQTDLDFSRQERDSGMAQALGHAEWVDPGFGERAYAALSAFVMMEEGMKFTSFQFIATCQVNGFDMPPTPKAFGSIFTKAARNGLILKVGYRPHPLRHASPTVLWEVV